MGTLQSNEMIVLYVVLCSIYFRHPYWCFTKKCEKIKNEHELTCGHMENPYIYIYIYKAGVFSKASAKCVGVLA